MMKWRPLEATMTAEELRLVESTLEFSEVAAWGLIVAALVYAAGLSRLPTGATVALAALAGLATKAMLLPLT
jgi:hypothetical protein